MNEFAFQPIQPINLADFTDIVYKLILDAVNYRKEKLTHVQLSENTTLGLLAARSLPYISYEYTPVENVYGNTLTDEFLNVIMDALSHHGNGSVGHCNDFEGNRVIFKSGDLVMVLTAEDLI